MPPKNIPGFYYDESKNRYFPVNGPIPGSSKRHRSSDPSTSSKSSNNASTSTSTSDQDLHMGKISKRKTLRSPGLLNIRELHGNCFGFGRRKSIFKLEYQKLQASSPVVWKYQRTTTHAPDCALEHLLGVVQTSKGLQSANLLAAGNSNGSISLYQVGTVGKEFEYGFECMPEPIWSHHGKHKVIHDLALGTVRCLASPRFGFVSSISCIKKIGKGYSNSENDNSSFRHALITTLGSGASLGSVNLLHLSEPIDTSFTSSIYRSISELASLNCTIWTADCNKQGTQAVIGTNCGASLINLETGILTSLSSSRSDVFSQQFDQSGNNVLCGLRNGLIAAIDIRVKKPRLLEHAAANLTRPHTNQTVGSPTNKQGKRAKSERYQYKGHFNPCNAVLMPSSVCSLVALSSDDQYFLGSSMDGSINLFDRRLLQRGAVQSYSGHVNSHKHLQLGVNPSETLIMSGGEDCYVRIWSLRTSELVFEEKVSESIFTRICWPREEKGLHGQEKSVYWQESNCEGSYELSHSWGAWLGAREGLFYMHGT